MKTFMRYILGAIAVISGMIFCLAAFPPAIDAIAHLSDAAYEYPMAITTISKVFSILVGIVACLANALPPDGGSKENEQEE